MHTHTAACIPLPACHTNNHACFQHWHILKKTGNSAAGDAEVQCAREGELRTISTGEAILILRRFDMFSCFEG